MRHKNMIKAVYSAWLVASLLWLGACDVKDPIYETDHPDYGVIDLKTDWSSRSQGVDLPSSYNVVIGDYSASLQGEDNRIDHLFAPGQYSMYIYNNAEHISVNGTTASVATIEAPAWATAQDAFIHSLPGWFFFCKQPVRVEKDTEQTLVGVMKQQVRQLTLIIDPTGGTVDKIESISAFLTGVAGSLNTDDDTHGTPSNVALNFTKIPSGADAGKWATTVRLLGVSGSEQKLIGMIRFAGGSPVDMPMESYLTGDLAQFNEKKNEALTLGGSVEVPTEAGFTATITGWESGGDANGMAW